MCAEGSEVGESYEDIEASCLCEGLCYIPERLRTRRGAKLRVPTSFSCSKPEYNHPETAFPCHSLFSSFPLLLVLISPGFVCNQTPPAAAQEASLVAAGLMGQALRSAVGRGGF